MKESKAQSPKSKVVNPWERRSVLGGGSKTEICDVTSRSEVVRESGVEKLRAIIAWPGTQKTVRDLARARLKKLTKVAEADVRPGFEAIHQEGGLVQRAVRHAARVRERHRAQTFESNTKL